MYEKSFTVRRKKKIADKVAEHQSIAAKVMCEECKKFSGPKTLHKFQGKLVCPECLNPEYETEFSVRQFSVLSLAEEKEY